MFSILQPIFVPPNLDSDLGKVDDAVKKVLNWTGRLSPDQSRLFIKAGTALLERGRAKENEPQR